MKESRTYNAFRNVRSGLINNFIILFTPFITRTIIIKILGSEYLGLNGLFTSILQVLNMAELGFSNAIVFSLYQPIAENDVNRVCAYLSLYKKVYTCIGAAIFTIGTIISPFLPYLINGSYPSNINLYIIYLLYLVNTSLSYFLFAYKSAILTAAQKQSKIYEISTGLTFAKLLFQIIVLIILKNYYFYLIGNLLYTIAYNLLIAIITQKEFPLFICKGKLDKSSMQQVIQEIKGLIIGKISFTSRNSFDNIVLSMFCGLTMVAIYSNYYYIFSSALGILLIIGQSITAGIGNCLATETADTNYVRFKKLNFYYNWIGSWFSVCLLCLYQPFMQLWLGKKFVAPDYVMLLFVIYFYITQISQLCSVYAAASGIWWEIRYAQIGEMIMNLCLNFILGWKFGITGILIATIITVFIFSFLMQAEIGFHCYFKINAIEYFIIEAKWVLKTFFMAFCSYYLCNVFNFKLLTEFIYCIIICTTIPNLLIFITSYINKGEKKYIEELIHYATKIKKS